MPTTNAPGGEICTMMTVSGTYTCNSNRVYVQGVGPGGSGQDGTATVGGGGGSAGQGLVGQYFPIAPGTVLTIQIGAVGKQSGTTTVSGPQFPTLTFWGGRAAPGTSPGAGGATPGDLSGGSTPSGNGPGNNHGVTDNQWIGGSSGGGAALAGQADDGREAGARCMGIPGGASGRDVSGLNAGAGGGSSPFGVGGMGGSPSAVAAMGVGYGAGGGGGARGSANLIGAAGLSSFVVLCS